MRSSFTYALAGVAALAAALSPGPVGAADCRGAVTHVPEAGVAYQPGRDVRGRPVAPADLPGAGRIQPPDSVAVDITGFARVPGSDGKVPLVGEVRAGQVRVDRAGRVTYQGQEIAPADDCR